MKKILLGVVALIAIGYGYLFFKNSPTAVPTDDGNYGTAFLDASPEGYAALGIKEDQPEAWEDGLRTDGKEGSYEWWYVDTKFEDGTTAGLVFYTKNRFDIDGPAHPTATLDVEFPDGTERHWKIQGEPGTVIDAAKDKADVKIGDSYLRYVDGDYEVLFTDGDVEFKISMKRTLPMWRPDTGHIYFGEEKEDFFAWFAALPASVATGTMTVDGKTQELKGTGYHDHNWGNIAMPKVMNHWYWGRATVGDYNLITVDLVSRKETGHTRIPVFMIAKDGKILSEDQNKTEVLRSDTFEHPYTNKFYDGHLSFVQTEDDGTVYTVEYIRDRDIITHRHVDDLPVWTRALATLFRVNSTYLRTLGEVKVTVEKDGQTETVSEEGIWEQMFLGNNKDAYIWN